MSFAEFKRAIDPLKDYLIFVILWNYGEPLLNPELEKMIKYCSSENIVVVLSTNANLMDQEKTRNLVNSELHYLIVSLDAISNDVYNQYRRGGDFSKVKKNVKILCALKKREKKMFPFVELQFIAMKNNEHQAYEFFKEAKTWQVNCATLKRFNTLLRCDEKEKFLPSKKEFVHTGLQESFQVRKKCKTPWQTMVITSGGKVIPCCSDYFCLQILGDCFSDELSAIWHSAKYRDLRKKVRKDCMQVNICRDCSNANGHVGSFIDVYYF